MFAAYASSWLILVLLLAVPSVAVEKIRSPQSIDDVYLPEQQDHLNITNDAAVITMDAGVSNNYSASFILPANDPLKFVFKVDSQGAANGDVNDIKLKLDVGNDTTVISLKFGVSLGFISFTNDEKILGSITQSNPVISFDFAPYASSTEGKLSNNGTPTAEERYLFPGLSNVASVVNGVRQLDFTLSWKSSVSLECHIPLSQFAVDAPPPPTTTTLSTTIESTSTTSEEPVEEEEEPSSTPPPLPPSTSPRVASARFTKRLTAWFIGCFLFLAGDLIILGTAAFFLRRYQKSFKSKSDTTPALPPSSSTQPPVPSSETPQPSSAAAGVNAKPKPTIVSKEPERCKPTRQVPDDNYVIMKPITTEEEAPPPSAKPKVPAAPGTVNAKVPVAPGTVNAKPTVVATMEAKPPAKQSGVPEKINKRMREVPDENYVIMKTITEDATQPGAAAVTNPKTSNAGAPTNQAKPQENNVKANTNQQEIAKVTTTNQAKVTETLAATQSSH